MPPKFAPQRYKQVGGDAKFYTNKEILVAEIERNNIPLPIQKTSTIDFSMISSPLILLLHPQGNWGIVSAELKRVDALGQYMDVVGALRADWLDNDDEDLRQLAILCEEMEPSRLYARYANKKLHKREHDFWTSDGRC